MSSEEEREELEVKNRQLLEQMHSFQERLSRLEAMHATARQALRILLALAVVILVLFSMYPSSLTYAQKVYNPTSVPSDYAKVNDFLAKQGKDTRVMWLPLSGTGHSYSWSPDKLLGYFEYYSSNPSLNDMWISQDTYGYFLQKELLPKTGMYNVYLVNKEDVLQKNLASRLFAPFTARYVVFDYSILGYDFGDRFLSDSSLKLVMQTPMLKVYKIKDSHDILWAASPTVKAQSYFDELSLMQKLPESTYMRTAFVNGTKQSVKDAYSPTDIHRYEEPPGYNWSFEAALINGQIPGWLPVNGNFTASYDSETRVYGKNSLKIVNKSTSSAGIGWVSGTGVAAVPGKMYSVETHLKYRNATWSAVAIEGYQEASNSWVELVQCPSIISGNSGWKQYDSSFVVPEGITQLRPMVAGGWALDPNKGPAVTWFDGIKISAVNDTLLTTIEGSPKPPGITFKKNSPERYMVRVKDAKHPFMLVFGESYDPLWVARTDDGKRIDPIPLYGGLINGFPVNKKGNYQIAVEYQPQSWFEWGLMVSNLFLVFFILYLLYWLTMVRSGLGDELDLDWRRLGGQLIVRPLSRFWSYIKSPPGDW